MKKAVILSIFLIFIALVGAAAWAKPVALVPQSDVYPSGVTEICATVKAVLPIQYTRGEKYVLERYKGGAWESVEKYPGGALFKDAGFAFRMRHKVRFDLTKYSDGLSEGRYRILMLVYDKRRRENMLSFEFTVE